MFVGYQPEYRWCLSYRHSYGTQPTEEILHTKYKDFPFSDNKDVTWAADEVRHSHTRRTLTQAIKIAADLVAEGDLEEAIFAINGFTVPQSVQPMKNSLVDLSIFEDYDLPIDTIPVPWKTFQNATGGMRGGDLWCIAARLGHGKSWTLAAVAADALMQGRNVVFYSLEMAERQVQSRMHAILAARLGLKITHSDLHHRKIDLIAYRKLVERIKEEVPGQMYVIDPSRGQVSPVTIQTQCAQADLVIVDYVGLMSSVLGGKAVDDWRSMASISNMLKEVAVTHDIPILYAAQINREGDHGGWKPPKVSQLSQSDALGQDADVVVTHKRYSKSSMVYSIEKNRHGESGEYFFTHFDPNSGNFAEINRDQADDIRDLEDV